jgi:hypothetical protein
LPSVQFFSDIQKSIALFKAFQASVACPDNSNIKIKKTMQYWWNDTDRENRKYAEKNIYQCFFVHHKLNVD